MKVRFNDSERTKEIFCDCRRFLAKVKGGEIHVKCPICKKWHIFNLNELEEAELKVN